MKKRYRIILLLLVCFLLLPMGKNVYAGMNYYTLEIFDYVPPVKIGLGHYFPLSGTIVYAEDMDKITVRISEDDSSNKTIEEVTLKCLDDKFDLSRFNSLVHFENLKAGNKVITIIARAGDEDRIVAKNSFEVKKSSDISVSGAEVPDRTTSDYYILKGIVTYYKDIKGIKIKVRNLENSKYEINKSFEVNDKTFDLSTIAHKIDFTNLKNGPKKLEYYIINEDGSERIFKGEYFYYTNEYYNVPVETFFYHHIGTLKEGQQTDLSGFVKASDNDNVNEVILRIIDVESNRIEKNVKIKGSWNMGWFHNDYINTRNLTVGEKKFKILATVDEKQIVAYEGNFNVEKYDPEVEITTEGIKIDSRVGLEESLNIEGIINSNKKVDSINVKVVPSEGSGTTFEKEYEINSNRFTFEEIQSDLKGVKFEEGYNRITIDAFIDEAKYLVVTDAFKVTDEKEEEERVSIDGFLTPTYIDLANPVFGFEGIVNSKEVLSKISIGIKNKKSNDYLMFKEIDNDTNSFDLSTMNKYFDFSTLPKGELEYKVSVKIGEEEITLRKGYVAVIGNDPAIDFSGIKIKAALAGIKKYFKFEGEIKATEAISTVEVTINKLDGDYTKVFKCNSNTFDMSQINEMIDFRALYNKKTLNLNIKVKTKSGKTARCIKDLCITDSRKVVTLEKSSLEYLKDYEKCDNIDLKGVITSNEIISQVKVVVPYYSNKYPKLVKVVDVNSNTFDLQNLKFELWPMRYYSYQMDIYVVIDGTSYLLKSTDLR